MNRYSAALPLLILAIVFMVLIFCADRQAPKHEPVFVPAPVKMFGWGVMVDVTPME